MIRLALSGAGGRVGREILATLAEASDVQLAGGLVRDGSPLVGQDLGILGGGEPLGVVARPGTEVVAALATADVLVDFSRPEAAVAYARAAADHGRAFLTGTTGLSDAQAAAIRACGERVPVLIAPNVSLGIAALLRFLPGLARTLGSDFDLEIVETHHRHKADAPSGTALALAEALAQARGTALDERAVFGRHGRAPRAEGEIGVHAVRAGGAAGEHRIILASEGEQLEIVHRAASRRTYASGALRAVRWLVAQPPGVFAMTDVVEDAVRSVASSD